MGIKAKLLATASAAVLLGGISLAKAADTDTKEPGDHALTSIDKNLKKDTDKDNRGLLNAKERIERNQARREAREKADRDARPDRPVRPDHPERPGR